VLVIVGHRRRASLLQGKARLRAIRRLDLALLIVLKARLRHDAKNQRPIRRVHVEPDDIGHFLLEPRVVRYLEAAHKVRLQAGLGPDAPHARRADAHLGRHRSPAPVCRVRRRLVRGLREHFEPDLPRQGFLATRARLVAQEPVDALRDVTLLPAPHARLRFACQPHDRVGTVALSRRKNDPRAPDRLARAVAIRDDRLEPGPVRRPHANADVVSPHARALTHLRPFGNYLSGGEH